MNKMKKFLSTVATLILSVTSAMPLIASAENYASGDLNNDGVINGSDCMLILNYYCDLSSDKVDLTSPETQIVLKYGDMNGDGIINTSDAMVIYKAGMKTLDPNEDGRVDEYDVKYIQNIAYNLEAYSFEELRGIMTRTSIQPTFLDEYYGYDFPELKKCFLTYAQSLISVLELNIGDTNNDGIIDASDSSELLSTYADISSGQQVNFNNDVYDFNGDGNVNSSDASQVLAYYAEISSGN